MKIDFQQYLSETGEIGFAEKTTSSLVYASGLPGAQLEELMVFESGELGQVMALQESTVELLSFSKTPVRVGTRIARTGRKLEVPTGEALLGSIINPLGHSLDESRPLRHLTEFRPVESTPAGIKSRVRISRPCETGTTIVDLLIPLGKGQRELVIGDPNTGKTLFLLRTLLSQVKQGTVGIYVFIGSKQMDIKEVEELLQKWGIREQTILVASSASDPAGIIYLAPYSAMTIAEYFRDQGRDVLLIFDDLVTHAEIYRELSLLGSRFPGRSSYPGDIFYVQAKLLERAGNFAGPCGEAAITCLPVVKSIQGDLTGYIQTNIMSQTDGHIFFDHVLFSEGRRPAINFFLSVTRVGRQAQPRLQYEIGRLLINFLRTTGKMHTFGMFGAELSEQFKRVLAKEEQIMEFFDQTIYDTFPANIQILIFGLIWGDFWSGKAVKEVKLAIQKVLLVYETQAEKREAVDKYIKSRESVNALLEKVDEYDLSR